MQEMQKTWARSNLWVRNIPWSRKWQRTPVFLPGKFHGQRSLAGYSPWGRKESDMTERAQDLGLQAQETGSQVILRELLQVGKGRSQVT